MVSMSVPEVAARGFGDAARAYERARPTYPVDLLPWLAGALSISATSRVCDLGAGTGKLTRALAGLSSRLVAVEPLAGMRAVLADEVPGAMIVGATAEALALRDGSLDAVVVAQAFHWFDCAASLDEIARTLRPGGGVALVWNAWDDTVEWVERIHRVVAGAGSTPQWQRGHRSRAWAADALGTHPRFGAPARAALPHAQTLTLEGVVDRVATTSHIAAADPVRREAVLAEVRDILATHPETRDRDVVEFPYVTEVYASVRS